MPNDLTVQPVVTMRSASGNVSEKTVAVPLPQQQGRASSPTPITNPTLRLDPALGLVVLEFRDNSGAITTSIPSQRQLAAYQKWDMTRSGPRPADRYKTVKPAPAAPLPEAHVHTPTKKGSTINK
jgi:hypothetical protein